MVVWEMGKYRLRTGTSCKIWGLGAGVRSGSGAGLDVATARQRIAMSISSTVMRLVETCSKVEFSSLERN